MKQIVAGIVAHVDAGKTTLSEALLYRTGEIRKLGRVDHGDAFLDTNSLEKARGITIFAHQALVEHGDLRLTLLDTPGHVDFAAETERVLRVLDYAILVVSGTDGVQGHTETLWRLLARYGVPTFIFVNKCDAAGFDREAILAQLRKRLSDAIYPLPAMEQSTEGSAVPLDALAEDIATLDEEAMNDYLEHGALSVDRLRSMIAVRELFPVYFGSALKLEGVEEFLDGLETFTREREWPAAFAARVFKIAHDGQHNRMTWLRVTGGALKAKEIVSSSSCAAASTAPSPVQGDDGTVWSEKVDQVRVYNGAKFETVTEIPAGSVCAVTGLTRTFPGEGLGAEPDAESPSLQPVLTYTVLPAGAESDTAGTSGAAKRGGAGHNSVNQDDAEHDAAKSGTGRNEENDTARQTAADNSSPARPQFDDLTLHKVITALRELEDEDPLLHVVWVERLAEIHVQLMGAVQLEIIQQTLHDRFGLDVSFGPGSILYRETITAPIEGAGHFEPLRHYGWPRASEAYRRRRLPPSHLSCDSSGAYGSQSWSQWPARDAGREPSGHRRGGQLPTAGTVVPVPARSASRHDRPCHERHPAHGRHLRIPGHRWRIRRDRRRGAGVRDARLCDGREPVHARPWPFLRHFRRLQAMP